MITLRSNAIEESDPFAINEDGLDGNNMICYITDHVCKGTWFRVFPQTWKDVMFLQYLDHHCDKFAPSRGDGVLISSRAMNMLTTGELPWRLRD